MQFTRLTPTKIAVRAGNEYREAGDTTYAMAVLRRAGGFIHTGAVTIDATDNRPLQAFDATVAAVRRQFGVPYPRAFWLVALRRRDTRHDDATQHDEAPDVQAVAYSWLFVQPLDCDNDTWRQAINHLPQRGQRLVCRCRGDIGVTVLDTSGSSTFISQENQIVAALMSNAMPLAWGSLAADALIPGSPTDIWDTALYAAVPHCNSSRMMFAFRGILKGGE